MENTGLRIGNYVNATSFDSDYYYDGDDNSCDEDYEEYNKYVVIVKIEQKHLIVNLIGDKMDFEILKSEGIKIDHEWLLRLGFINKDIFTGFQLKTEKYSLYHNNNVLSVIDFSNKNGIKYTNCNYVHELQNLYFGIIGSELQIVTEAGI